MFGFANVTTQMTPRPIKGCFTLMVPTFGRIWLRGGLILYWLRFFFSFFITTLKASGQFSFCRMSEWHHHGCKWQRRDTLNFTLRSRLHGCIWQSVFRKRNHCRGAGMLRYLNQRLSIKMNSLLLLYNQCCVSNPTPDYAWHLKQLDFWLHSQKDFFFFWRKLFFLICAKGSASPR